MKAFGTLLLYFFSGSSLVLGAGMLGLAVLAFALSAMRYVGNEHPLSSGMLVLALVLMLAVPFIGAGRTLRLILGNRRLAGVPGLPVITGLALLALSVLLAVIPPLAFWLLGAPAAVFWLAVYLFVLASLCMAVMQLLVTSPYFTAAINWLPIIVILLGSLLDEQLLALARNRVAVAALASISLVGWGYALAVLARRRSFKRWCVGSPLQTSGGIYIPAVTTWIEARGIQRVSPAASLLFAYPASLRSRLWNITGFILLHPLIAVLVVQVMMLGTAGVMPFNSINFFLVISLMTCIITTLTNYADAGARARLLWLHVPGARADVWHTVERELWTNLLIQGTLAALIALALAVYGAGSAFALHYVVLVFVMPMYECYLMLLARVQRWPSLVYALAVIASLAAAPYGVYRALRFASFDVVLLVELGLLLAAVLFRSLAKSAFTRVDWQALRPATLGGKLS